MRGSFDVAVSDYEPPTIDVGSCIENGASTAPVWLSENLPGIREALLTHGSLYLAGCGVKSRSEFSLIRDLLFHEPTHYREKATPRTEYGSDVYSATDLPATQPIHQHNENSYTLSFPGKLLFGCLKAPRRGGATTVADVRKVLRDIGTKTRLRMAESGWMLTRNYQELIGLPWQTAFSVSDRRDVEEYCSANDIRCTWNGDVLRTVQIRPGVIRHPHTLELLWFNHAAFWNEWSLDTEVRDVMISEFGSDGLPFNTYFGDGSDITADEIADINRSYEKNVRRRPWAEGDLLLVDNLLSSHGRDAFVGEREVAVAMGDPVELATCMMNPGA